MKCYHCKKQNLKCTELCGCSRGCDKKMNWHVIYTSLEMVLQKEIAHNSYLFCFVLFILVRLFRNDYFIQLNISGSVLVTHIDWGYDYHLEGELFM